MGRSAAMDDDPLAELERIISGKMPPAPEPESPAPESPAPESFAPEREGEQGGEDAFGDDALEALFESGFEDAFSLEMDGDAAAAPAAAARSRRWSRSGTPRP